MVTRDSSYRLSCLKTQRNDPSLLQTLAKVSVSNACNLVPTVFLQHGKTKFELPLSFSVYSRHRKTEFVLKTEFVFRFRFLFSYYTELTTSIFVFSQLWTTDFKLSNNLFSSFVFVRNWKSEFELRVSFIVSVIFSLSCFTWTGRMLAHNVANNWID